MALTVDQQNTDIALVNTSKPPASSPRARFIGQGYKQVRSVLPFRQSILCSPVPTSSVSSLLSVLLENHNISLMCLVNYEMISGLWAGRCLG